MAGCQPAESELAPDDWLQSELGLSPGDRVHTVTLATGVSERPDPPSVRVVPGDLVQFVSSDWMVHEVHFEVDSMAAPQRGFLEETGQAASPPLLQRDARFVLTFEGAPPGRYPYRLEGNREPGQGVIVVVAQEAR